MELLELSGLEQCHYNMTKRGVCVCVCVCVCVQVCAHACGVHVYRQHGTQNQRK